jgi:hypothetical protein
MTGFQILINITISIISGIISYLIVKAFEKWKKLRVPLWILLIVMGLGIIFGFFIPSRIINSDNENRPMNTENGPNNEVQHKGTLVIRVLSNSKPISFIGSYVSCAIKKQPEVYDPVYSKEVTISNDCKLAFINCKINDERWLLDMYVPEMKMPNCNIEINGRIIPAEFIEQSDDRKSANYKIRLKKIN